MGDVHALPCPDTRAPAAPALFPGYTQTFPLLPASVPLARLSVRTTLRNWCLLQLFEPAVLVASELVTNAVQHAAGVRLPGEDPGRCRLTVEQRAPGAVRIMVADSSGRRPTRRRAAPDEERGRGLDLVDAVAERWGTDLFAWGKRVWADVADAS